MKRLICFFIGFAVFFQILSCESSASKFDLPNIIIVMTDDQGYGDLGINGNKIIITPNIDDFASRSVNFSNYHVGTTCSPTRAGLMTARNCLRNGVWHTNAGCSLLNQEEETIADVFSNAGYNTGMFGKWHLGDNFAFLPEQRGFNETFYHKGGGVGQTPDFWGNDYLDDTYFKNGLIEKTKGYCTDVFFDKAISFIKNSKKKPFLCYLSLNAPHSPFNVPEKYYNIYKDNPNLLQSQKRFYGMITNIDDNFGRLIKSLDDLNLSDNTIMIFTTDNGTSNGYKFNKNTNRWLGFNAGMRGTKTSEYDGGHRVPFIMNWKKGGFDRMTEFNGLSSHVDILPTLASFSRIEFKPKKIIDGIDLSAYLQKNKKPDRILVTDTQRNQWPQKWKQTCVMFDNWRLINGNELYNINNDPGQEINLYEDNPLIVKKLIDYYNDWWSDVSKEFNYTYINIEPNQINTLTSHDIHVNSITAWHQRDVRKGVAYEIAPFSLNFKESGVYEFSLRRWPKEVNLKLAETINDNYPSTKYWDEKGIGKSMKFSSAFLKIGDEYYKKDVDNLSKNVKFKINVGAGKKTVESGFVLKNGKVTTSFYTYIKKINP